jgi:hypothetical protein
MKHQKSNIFINYILLEGKHKLMINIKAKHRVKNLHMMIRLTFKNLKPFTLNHNLLINRDHSNKVLK